MCKIILKGHIGECHMGGKKIVALREVKRGARKSKKKATRERARFLKRIIKS